MTKPKTPLQGLIDESNKTAHTPGPWTITGGFSDSGKDHDFFPIRSKDRVAIASVITPSHANVPVPEGRANALLIAAAPTMRAELEYAAEWIRSLLMTERGALKVGLTDRLARIEAVIATAEGR